jgi:hypothetical protein
MSLSAPKFKILVERYLDFHHVETPEARQVAYRRIISVLQRQLETAGTSLEDVVATAQILELNAAIAQIEAERAGYADETVKPELSPQRSFPVSQIPPSTEKSSSWFFATKICASIVGIAVVGYWLTGFASNTVSTPLPYGARSSSGIDRKVEAARESFKLNRALVEELSQRIEGLRKDKGALPNTGGLIAWARFVQDNPKLAGVRTAPFNRGSIIVRTEGADYKILVVQSGDCITALIEAEDLVDPPRSGGNLDCVYYGRWTEAARGW